MVLKTSLIARVMLSRMSVAEISWVAGMESGRGWMARNGPAPLSAHSAKDLGRI
jgi:hypothetical protein